MTYGRWTILGKGTRKQYVLCRCACGTEKEVFKPTLINGMSQSCGCLRVECHMTHGASLGGRRIPEYCIWTSMNQRCNNPKAQRFESYGGRGIRVCDEWRHSFQAFLDHIGRRPHAGLFLDRIDNDKGYEPGNVRWADGRTSAMNTRMTPADRAARARRSLETRRRNSQRAIH